MTTTATKERPILMSDAMVRAILAGRKTQTRRIAKPPVKAVFLPDDYWQIDIDEPGTAYLDDESGRLHIACPYGKPNDLLWVREAHDIVADPGARKADIRKWTRDEMGDRMPLSVDYRADGPHKRICDKLPKGHANARRWKPSIHMPRWASRITLRIADVHVERVQEISEEDAKAEGVFEALNLDFFMYDAKGTPGLHAYDSAKDTYACLWDVINGPGAWERNDWVWALSFERMEPSR